MINSVRKYEIGSDVESRLRKIHYTNGNEQLCIEVSKNIKGILDLIPVFNSKKKSTFTHRKLIGFLCLSTQVFINVYFSDFLI